MGLPGFSGGRSGNGLYINRGRATDAQGAQVLPGLSAVGAPVVCRDRFTEGAQQYRDPEGGRAGLRLNSTTNSGQELHHYNNKGYLESSHDPNS